jgi:hypothetical protein
VARKALPTQPLLQKFTDSIRDCQVHMCVGSVVVAVYLRNRQEAARFEAAVI